MYQGLGNGENGRLTFFDAINLTSFIIGMMNLNENLTQGDKQELLETFSKKADDLLNEIHSHLKEQDTKINEILEELHNDNRRNIQPDRESYD